MQARTALRWLHHFEQTGNTTPAVRKKSPVNDTVRSFIEDYIKLHPCFYLEEMQSAYLEEFGQSVSQSTLCRIIKNDLKYTRKKLTRQAREALPKEIEAYYERLKPFYQYPSQLVFVDETLKDQRASIRHYAWSKVGQKAFVRLPSSRGKRVSCFASFTTEGFLAWTTTDGTFDRHKFHSAFMETVYPYLNPWPLPRSIVVMDNAKIHMYPELEKMINEKGALLVYLSPYCPQLNPIETGFSLLKRWIQKNANLTFGLQPEYVLSIAMRECTKGTEYCAENLFHHAGYLYNRIVYNATA